MQMWDLYPFPCIHVFTSRKKARKFIKRKTGLKLDWLGKSAQTDYYRKAGAESLAVVTLNCGGATFEQKVAIVAHECSHIVDSWLKDIGEDSPGEEVRAYAIQCAILTCLDQIDPKWLR